jgi:hypothetical protein
MLGAATENRTRNICLEGRSFTIKLRPQLERDERIELSTKPWQGFVLPLNQSRYDTFNSLNLSAAYEAANACGLIIGTTLHVPRI